MAKRAAKQGPDQQQVLLRYSLLLVAVWSVVVSASFMSHFLKHRRCAEKTGYDIALANLNKDQAIRHWSAVHGGVYVPIDELTPPNPYLSHVSDRDVITDNKKKLTLMNPAYMIRQFNEMFGESYGIQGHITSLKPLRPENAPDAWERQALESFAQGNTEVKSFISVAGKPFLRLMRPIMTSKGCLKCHEHQGYRVGDVRGGVAVRVEMAELYALSDSANRTTMLWHSFIFLLGLSGIALAFFKLRRQIEINVKQAELLLENSLHQAELKRYESLKTMAGAIAHKFNNAMTAVLGNLEFAEMTLAEKEEEFQMISDALAAARGASRVGSLMLTYLGQQPSQLERTNLTELVREVVDEMESDFSPSITLKYIAPSAPLECQVDRQLIKDVVRNIISNAIDSLASAAGTIEITFGHKFYNITSFPLPFQNDGASLSEEVVDRYYTFCQIRDSGCGISKENLERVFEPFFTTKFVGRGLGLALTVGIMQAHHGALTIESNLANDSGSAKGTTVRVLLPAIIEPD